MISLFMVLFFALQINLVFEITRFLVTFEEFDKLSLVIALIIIQAIGVALNSRYSRYYVYIASAAYTIQELVNLFYWLNKMSQREKDDHAGEDAELYSREHFNLFFTCYACFLCQDTKFLMFWFTPIYTVKFFVLLYNTDTDIILRLKLYISAIVVAYFFHYLLTVRELKRFYQYQSLLKREQAIS